MGYRPRDDELRELATLLVHDSATSAPRDWSSLVERAVTERVAPLLHHRLPASASIPEPLRFCLKRELYRSGALNELLYRELFRLLERSHGAGLATPVVLKGGALAIALYEEIALRPMSDIDLLVQERELASWTSACRELGFDPTSPEMAPGLAAHVHYHLALANERAHVELHFGLVGGRSDWRAPETEWFRSRTVPLPMTSSSPGAEAVRLDATAHLLYACAHAVLQHGAAQAPLLWFYDLHAIVTRWGEEIDWPELIERSRTFHWSGTVARGLTLSKELFGTSLPPGLTEELETSEPERRHARRKADPRLSRAELVWREMGCVGPRDRLRWALAILFPTPTYLKWRYPRAKRVWPLLYLYRLGVVLREGLGALAIRARPPAC